MSQFRELAPKIIFRFLFLGLAGVGIWLGSMFMMERLREGRTIVLKTRESLSRIQGRSAASANLADESPQPVPAATAVSPTSSNETVPETVVQETGVHETVVHETGTEDLTALDRINALNIPDDLKQRILRNYELTGELPEIVVRKGERKPAKAAEL